MATPNKLFLSANLIGVEDVEKAKQWYEEVFGMETVTYKPPYFLEMSLGEATFLIEKQSPERAPGFQHIPTGVRVSSVIGVADLQSFINEVKSKGVRVVLEPVKQGWGGWNAVIADPDGNEWILDQDAIA